MVLRHFLQRERERKREENVMTSEKKTAAKRDFCTVYCQCTVCGVVSLYCSYQYRSRQYTRYGTDSV